MYNNNNGGGGFGGNRGGGGFGGPRQMVQGDWKCKNCAKDIKELPFEPRDPDNVLCRDCHMQNRPARTEGGFGGGADRGPRQMVQGNWTCNECGKEITELPFMPSGDRPVTCRDCHAKARASRPSFGGGRY